MASRLSVLAVSVTAMVFVFMHLDSSVLEWNYLSMALRGSGIFLPLTFCIFFPGSARFNGAWLLWCRHFCGAFLEAYQPVGNQQSVAGARV